MVVESGFVIGDETGFGCGFHVLQSHAVSTTNHSLSLLQLKDFYDVSLVDGYNLAISITPIKGSGKCSYAGCVGDLNMMCSVGLQVRSHDNKRVVACESACFAFNSPRYCCTGSFGSPQACKPTAYSRIFSRRLVLRLTLMLMMILLAFLLALAATIWSNSALTTVD
ncbi:hypothetical protein SO802_007677 [Lithocarpus litseifolius]|uniref:Thaumatin-like protein n=1 Tax=Lithocarpus litseifolius TaxID=425828 RepID=A0AAW2DR17_9ROSI